MVVWNLQDLMREKDIDQHVAKLTQLTSSFAEFEKKLFNKNNCVEVPSDTLRRIFALSEEISKVSSRLAGFAELSYTEKTNDAKRLARLRDLSKKLVSLEHQRLFFSEWIRRIPESYAKKIAKQIEPYTYVFEKSVEHRKHLRSPAEEKIMSLKDTTGVDVLERVYNIVTNKYVFGKKQLAQEELLTLVRSSKEHDRKQAYEDLLLRYKEDNDVLFEIYAGVVMNWHNEELTVRGYDAPIAPRNEGNDVEHEIVENLLSVIENNAALFQEYFSFKANLLGMKNTRYNLYAPYRLNEPSYTFPEAKKTVLEVFKNFSPVFASHAKSVFDKQHVHSPPMKGKKSGAFCYSVTNDTTPYVLVNFAGKLNDVFTLGHELGHAVHGILGQKNTQFTFHSSLPLAETASIFSELLLTDHLLKTASKRVRTFLLVQELDKIYASVMRQAFFVMFEKEAHELIAKGATADEINARYAANLRRQFGKQMIIPDHFSYEWSYIPHIFESPFYCYAYAFGNLLVLSLYHDFTQDKKAFVPRYQKILEAGGSATPATILARAGYDISTKSFWQNGFDEARKIFDELKTLTK
ncbi:MAG: M3 family oligoendopeptidase [Candidatus Woesearchaeota archaeon]|nr:MAG: M3 family oligoendopeptidase [Candidatus Woesearchaeota archaeon]